MMKGKVHAFSFRDIDLIVVILTISDEKACKRACFSYTRPSNSTQRCTHYEFNSVSDHDNCKMFFVESVGNYECHAVAAAKDSSEDQVEKCFEGRMIILHSVAEKWFDT